MQTIETKILKLTATKNQRLKATGGGLSLTEDCDCVHNTAKHQALGLIKRLRGELGWGHLEMVVGETKEGYIAVFSDDDKIPATN